MKNISKAGSLLFLIIIAASVFRLFSISWGLPERYADDETNYIEMGLRMGIGKFEPATLQHGTFFSDILFIVYALYFVAGRIMGIFASPENFVLSYVKDPSMVTIIARFLVVLFSAGSFYLTYLIGRKVFSGKIGLAAVFLLSLSPIHYMMSTIGYADMAASFLLLLSFYLLLKYYFSTEPGAGLKFFYFSGFVLGLSLATKLLILPGLAVYLTVYFMKQRKLSRVFKKSLFIGISLAAVGFLAAEPYAFLEPLKLLNSMLWIMVRYIGIKKAAPPAYAYIFEWMPNTLGMLSAVILFVAATFFLLSRKKGAILVMLFPFFHFLPFIFSSGFAYYLLPSLPFIFLIISEFFSRISAKAGKWGNILFVILTFICAFNPALDTFRYYLVINSKDTRQKAVGWFEEHVPSGKSVILEGALGNDMVLGPKLSEDMDTLKDSFKWKLDHGGSGRFQKALIDNFILPKKPYRLFKVSQNFKLDDIVNTDAEYLISSGFFDLSLGHLEGYREKKYYHTYDERKSVRKLIEKKYILIKKIEPFPQFGPFYPHFLSGDFRALKEINIFGNRNKIMPGPEIRIYKRIP